MPLLTPPFGLTDLQAAGIVIGLGLSVIALFKGILPICRGAREVWSEFRGALAAFGGRDSFVDHATGDLVPAVPPLGKALADLRKETGELRKDVTDLASVVSRVADQQVQLDNHAQRLDRVEGATDTNTAAISAFIATTFENGAKSAMEAVKLTAAGQAEVVDVEAKDD